MLPNFIIAGTFPAGTGHLYGLLVQHPEVYLAAPMQPECNFFFKTRLYDKGIDYYMKTWFSGVRGKKAVGERSSLLLSSEKAPPRVAKHLPEMKLIFLFRNPVDRAYANYRFTALAGYEDLTFEEALDAEELRVAEAAKDPFWSEIQPHSYYHRGLYAEQLQRWLSYFPPGQMLLMRSDELLRDQSSALRKVYRFLGVDESFVAQPFPDFSSPAVIDVKLQRRMRQESPDGFDAAIQRLRLHLPPQTELDRRVRANVSSGYDPLPAELRQRLTARYSESNRQFQSMVPFATEDWL